MEKPLPRGVKYEKLKLAEIVESLRASADLDESNALKTEFYKRLNKKFLDRCHKVVHRLHGNHPEWQAIRDDVFQESFIIALAKLHKFVIGLTWDETTCEIRVLAWMSKIANVLLLKGLKANKQESIDREKYLHFDAAQKSDGESAKRKHVPTYDAKKFDLIWKKLNPMSKEILLLCAACETLEEENVKHLPDEHVVNLKEKYNVSSVAIRQAKSRAILALKSCKL